MRNVFSIAALSVLLGLRARSAEAAPVELCERAVRQGWRSSSEGHVFPPWFFRHHTRFEVGAADGMRRLIEALKAKGITPILVVVPPAPLVLGTVPPGGDIEDVGWSKSTATAAYRELVWWLEQQGATVVSVLDLGLQSEHPDAFFLRLDHHWSPEGSRRTAEAVAKVIEAHPSWGSVPKRRFDIVEDGSTTLRFGGSGGKSIQKLCKTPMPDTEIPLFRSKALEPPSVGLLDDTPPMPVVVLGSSFSAPKFAFSAFLRAALGVEVLLAHTDGGRLTASALNYFTSADFRERPPTWVVWEMAIATEGLAANGAAAFLGETDVYRQLVPAVAGDCDAPVVSGSTPFRSGTTPLLGADNALPTGVGHYLVFDISGPTPGPITVVTRFADGGEDRFEFGGHMRVKVPERFFMEFPAYRTGPVERVSLESAEGSSGSVQYRVCAY